MAADCTFIGILHIIAKTTLRSANVFWQGEEPMRDHRMQHVHKSELHG